MREHTRINRILLCLIGIVLLAGGLTVLAAGADIFRRWNVTPPDGWPLTTSQNVLVPGAEQARWVDQGWWWPTVIATLAVVMLLALWWLFSQAHRHRALRLSVGGTSRHTANVSDGVIDDALTADLEALPGVRKAQAHLEGQPVPSMAEIGVTLDPDTAPEQAVRDVDSAVERARRSAGWEELPTRARLRVARHGAQRVE